MKQFLIYFPRATNICSPREINVCSPREINEELFHSSGLPVRLKVLRTVVPTTNLAPHPRKHATPSFHLSRPRPHPHHKLIRLQISHSYESPRLFWHATPSFFKPRPWTHPLFHNTCYYDTKLHVSQYVQLTVFAIILVWKSVFGSHSVRNLIPCFALLPLATLGLRN